MTTFLFSSILNCSMLLFTASVQHLVLHNVEFYSINMNIWLVSAIVFLLVEGKYLHKSCILLKLFTPRSPPRSGTYHFCSTIFIFTLFIYFHFMVTSVVTIQSLHDTSHADNSQLYKSCHFF